MATVRTRVKGFTGVVAGVEFTDGEAETGNGPALAYFRRAGYTVDGVSNRPERPEPPDPRHVGADGDGVQPVGSRLRDAAVDPRPEDFLPPTNAGRANPHAPLVVAPGLHAVTPGPIVPGPVSSDTRRQEAIETAVAGAVLAEQRDVGDVTREAAEENPTPRRETDGATVDPAEQASESKAGKPTSGAQRRPKARR